MSAKLRMSRSEAKLMASELGIETRGMRTDDIVNAVHAERGRRMEQDNLMERAKQEAIAAVTAKQAELKAEILASIAADKPKPEPVVMQSPRTEPVPERGRHEESKLSFAEAFSFPPDMAQVMSMVPDPEAGDGTESNGESGALRFVDCDGAEIFTLYWENGKITSKGDHTIRVADCGGSSSSSTYTSGGDPGDSTDPPVSSDPDQSTFSS